MYLIGMIRGQHLFVLAFPRDGTSRCPFVPVSLCPGTRAGVIVPGQNHFLFLHKFKKKSDFSRKKIPLAIIKYCTFTISLVSTDLSSIYTKFMLLGN